MKDDFGREIAYLRISITDRCNLKCSYCNPQGNMRLNHDDILRYEEIIEIVRCTAMLGVSHVRVTGGEPFARKDCLEFVKKLTQIEGIQTVSITTNGTMLGKEEINALSKMSISGINISIDSFDREKYMEITGVDALERVLSTIVECQRKNILVKLNAVLMSEKQVLSMLSYLKSNSVIIRFIEQMPMSERQKKESLSGKQILSLLKEKGISYKRTYEVRGFGPAVYYKMDGYQGILGLIEPMHGKFCYKCNRIRLTASGDLKGCLYYPGRVNLKEIFKGDYSYEQKQILLQEKIQEVIRNKPEGHHFEEEPAGIRMNEIGG